MQKNANFTQFKEKLKLSESSMRIRQKELQIEYNSFCNFNITKIFLDISKMLFNTIKVTLYRKKNISEDEMVK